MKLLERYCRIACLSLAIVTAPFSGIAQSADNAPGSSRASLNSPATLTNNLDQAVAVAKDKLPQDAMSPAQLAEQQRAQLELARHYRHMRLPRQAEPVLVDLVSGNSPEPIKQQALLELAMVARDAGELSRSQQIYAQYLSCWPNDLLIPEILLRQGQLFREMGLNNLALAKFYAVMTSSLVLKNDKMEYYQRLVLSAQTEIAQSHFLLGKYAEAADFFSRLLKQANPGLNRSQTQYYLIRSLSALERNDDTVVQGTDFLAHYSEASEEPEVRFLLALALKRLGRNGESLQQVLSLLQDQKQRIKEHPELWAYWQQQAGNEIGNQLYREGDYVRALSIYQALTELNAQPVWQLPVGYQIGLTYERLAQPQKALQTYESILQRESEFSTNGTPATKSLFEMARWRADFVRWQTKAELASAAAVGVNQSGAARTGSASPETKAQ